ncbi:MAG TPA: tryptophan--tRNA ligase, partial [bacterium]|nr:tryptophan--tRNA ligase [bacterium]
TGKLHVGHYIGSLKNRVKLQDEYDEFILIADVQALTDNFDDAGKVRGSILELVKDYLAVGIDPEKVTIFQQSKVPAIHELFQYLANFISVEQMKHNPTLKSELAEKKNSKSSFKSSTPLGFFIYPAHQVADILSVNADLVPVGEDQLPMIELTRSVARKINRAYNKDIFKVPEAKVGEEPRLVGTDGNRKMSKSLGNCIYLADDEATLRKKVMDMYTDPNRIKVTDPGKVEGNPVFIYHDLFNSNKDEVEDLKERYTSGNVGDVEVKEKLYIAMNSFFTPIREQRLSYENRDDYLADIISEGSKKVRQISDSIVQELREAIGIELF